MSFKLKSDGVLGSERSECCWGRSKQRKPNVEEGGRLEGTLGAKWGWSGQLWTVSMCEVWLLFKSVPAAWHLSCSSPSSVLGSAWVTLGIQFPKDMRESPAKFCTPRPLPDLIFPSLPSTEVPDLAPSATPPTIWNSCFLQSSTTKAQYLRMGYICISFHYCCLLFLDFNQYLYIQVFSGK